MVEKGIVTETGRAAVRAFVPAARRMALLLKIIESDTGVGRDIILGERRDRSAVRVRQVAHVVAKRYFGDISLSELGRLFRRDHTTFYNSDLRIASGTDAEQSAILSRVEGRFTEALGIVASGGRVEINTTCLSGSATVATAPERPPIPTREQAVGALDTKPAHVRWRSGAGYLDCNGNLICYPW